MYTILVVEDDPVLRDAYGEGLSLSGYAVRSAASFAEARAQLHGPVDAVLTDLDLGPGQAGGYAVLEEARLASPRAPVIVVTGTDEPTGGARAITAGAFAYLLKPVTLAELRSTVARALQGLELLRSRRA